MGHLIYIYLPFHYIMSFSFFIFFPFFFLTFHSRLLLSPLKNLLLSFFLILQEIEQSLWNFYLEVFTVLLLIILSRCLVRHYNVLFVLHTYLCILIVMFIFSYFYVYSIPCILFNCVVLCIVCVWMGNVLLPASVNPIAVNKYIITYLM